VGASAWVHDRRSLCETFGSVAVIAANLARHAVDVLTDAGLRDFDL
jgi:hypothetical protein